MEGWYRKMHSFRSCLALLIISFVFFNSISCEELIELSCFDSSDCKQFERPDVNVTCHIGECRCNRILNNSTTEKVIKCLPTDIKQNNIIGGNCPCQMPNAECNESENICYCEKNFLASTDKRRCLRASVIVGDDCELDAQCHGDDHHTNCKSKKCTCRQDFIMHNGTCISVLAPNTTCESDQDCQRHGAHVHCLAPTHKCTCLNGYIKAENRSECIEVASYGDNCTHHQQCQTRLGPGGACLNGTCQCNDNYYLQQKQFESESKVNVTHSICSRVIEIGQYCRVDKDCYHQQFPDEEQTMSCILSECNCKWSFNSFNNTECFKTSDGNTLRPMIKIAFIAVIVVLQSQI